MTFPSYSGDGADLHRRLSAVVAPGRDVRRVSLSFPVVLIIAAAYLIPGLFGHDPWKQDEAYVFGITQHFLDSGDWVVPMVAGEPFMEKPPLYYWVAAACAWLLSRWIPLHDGARLATGIFMALTFSAVGSTVRRWWGSGYGRFAVLALLGCLGLIWYGHLMLTDVPVLTGFAISASGFALARSRALAGGLLIGIGIGVGFLAKGLLTPGVLGLTAALLPICFSNWRNRTYFHALAIALLAALPWLLIWPIALYLRSPSLFIDWFWLNNIGRFIGFSVPTLGAASSKGYWLHIIPWFTFPALPLALTTVWQRRTTISTSAPIQFSLVSSGLLMTLLVMSASARPSYALPLLVVLCVLAAPAAVALPARIDRFWDLASRALFGTIAASMWTLWLWMMVKARPPHWPPLIHYLPEDFLPTLDFDAIAIAPLLTLSAAVYVGHLSNIRGRGLISWTIGMTLAWGLVCTLFLPWLDYAKSYRSVFVSMQAVLPQTYGCMASSGLGESERAMLGYIVGINTQRREIVPTARCNLLLINGKTAWPPHEMDLKNWTLIWEGARPGDTREHFWLFRATSQNPLTD